MEALKVNLEVKTWWSFKSISELIRYWRAICNRVPNYLPENVATVVMDYDGWGTLRGETANNERERLGELYQIMRRCAEENSGDSKTEMHEAPVGLGQQSVEKRVNGDKLKVIDARDKVNNGRRGKVVKELVKIIRDYELNYDEFVELCSLARVEMQLVRKERKKVDKQMPSIEEVKKFMQCIEKHSSADALMIKILIFMGIRSCELVRIKISDLDLTPGKEMMFTNRKAGLDKNFVIPEKIASLLRLYVSQASKQVYLFESGYHKPYSEKAGAIRKMMQRYRREAGVSDLITPHACRHLLLTTLGGKGWTDSELQKVSGHASRVNLDKYTHLNPELIRNKLNRDLSEAMQGV